MAASPRPFKLQQRDLQTMLRAPALLLLLLPAGPTLSLPAQNFGGHSRIPEWLGHHHDAAAAPPPAVATAADIVFEPPVRMGAGANMENVYALSPELLLTNIDSNSKSVALTRDAGRSWGLGAVGNFSAPRSRNYLGVLGGPAGGIGPYWYRSADGHHLQDFGTIVESMGSRGNFSSFRSPTVDVISADPSSPAGFSVRKVAGSPVEVAGFPQPLRCGADPRKLYRTSPGGCPMYLDDSGSAVLAGPPQTTVQLAEVAFANYAVPNETNDTIVALVSTDGGKRWTYASTVADAAWFPLAQEGPSENALCVLSDRKTLLAMFRMDGGDGCSHAPAGSGCVTQHKPYYKATSTNKGLTFSFPAAVLGTGAARPRLMQLGGGAGPLILGGGRALNLGTRDILLWINADGMATSWHMFSISYQHNRLAADPSDRFTKYVNCSSATPEMGNCSLLPGGGGAETSSYTTVLSLGGRSGIITYNRELNQTSPGVFENHKSMTYSMRFHFADGPGEKPFSSFRAALLPSAKHDDEQEVNVVTDFGACPKGVQDSTVALVAAHATGKQIFYPNGRYRFNSPALRLSGGVRRESDAGVIVFNNISNENVLQFDGQDGSGRLIGLQENHMEWDHNNHYKQIPPGTQGSRMEVGALVPPPVSTANRSSLRAAVLGFWYNDGGLEARRATPGSGWVGWYYWTWAFHAGLPVGSKFANSTYDPARKPLLGFYRGDDVNVLGWQCYWLREYGVGGVILIGSGVPQNDTKTSTYWQYQLFNNVPNFRGLGYIMTMPDGAYRSTGTSSAVNISAEWKEIAAATYFRQPDNAFVITRNGRGYPMVFIWEEASLRGVFDHYAGNNKTLAFYVEMAATFRSHGFGGISILGRHPIGATDAAWELLEAEGVLHFAGGYGNDYWDSKTSPANRNPFEKANVTYSDHVYNYTPPVGQRVVASTATSLDSHYPHPSNYRLPGTSPQLFEEELTKAVGNAWNHSDVMQPIVTVYNIGEWAEGGPGLQPNQKDRFGYLQAVKNVVMKVDDELRVLPSFGDAEPAWTSTGFQTNRPVLWSSKWPQFCPDTVAASRPAELLRSFNIKVNTDAGFWGNGSNDPSHDGGLWALATFSACDRRTVQRRPAAEGQLAARAPRYRPVHA